MMIEEVVDLLDEIQFPSAPHEPEINMTSCILFGKEKCGKTTALAQLENCLIIDSEQGSKKVKALALPAPEDKGPVGKMLWLKKVAEKLIRDGKKYDYVALDTLTEINDWAEWSGTFKYMNSVQGQSFNRVKDPKTGLPIKNGPFLDPDDPDYLSVHTLPEGYGYRWSRDELLDIFNLFKSVARKCVFYVCHVEDKFLGLKDTTETVVTKQLALTGALRNMLPRKVDAIGYIYNEKGTIKINFTATETTVGGNRAKHLIGYNDVLDWKKIFIEENS